MDLNESDTMSRPKQPGEARKTVLDAAIAVIRAKGYADTTVDDICRTGGVTKGTFFHYFKSKEDMALAAADQWGALVNAEFANAPYQRQTDPAERVLGYIDYRKSLLTGDPADFTCLLGTMVQEAFDTHPRIRAACERHLREPAAILALEIEAALKQRGIVAEWSPESLALYTQAVLQGAFILAKASQSPQVAIESVDHLRRYLAFVFGSTGQPGPAS